MFKPVITSLLDTDLYKLTMMQVYLHQFPQASGTYAFKCRNYKGKKLGLLAEEINKQLDHLCTLKFTKDELDYLRNLRFIKPDFVDFLKLFQLDRESIKVSTTDNPDNLDIRVSGPLVHRSYFEIFVLAIVNEVYFRQFESDNVYKEGLSRFNTKMNQVKSVIDYDNPYAWAEFGTRRRFSREWQEKLVTLIKDGNYHSFRGTSNVDLARRLGLTPIGTMAHEYLQAHQAFDYKLKDFQKAALENWVKEYRGDLGIALTDVIGMDEFLNDFDLYFAKLFDGLRHDSGCPFEWGEKAIAHYKKLGIDPKSKILIFSDGLDFDKAIELYKCFADRIKVTTCLGTNITNDLGVEALNIVMKIIECNNQPVLKRSDSPGKTMCEDKKYIALFNNVFPPSDAHLRAERSNVSKNDVIKPAEPTLSLDM